MSMFVIVIGLIVNTVVGLVWLLKFKRENDEDFLKTEYLVESIILLAIPIALALFFVVIILIVIGIW